MLLDLNFRQKHVDSVVWIPGKSNLADPGTKQDSPLSEALKILLSIGKIPIDMSAAEIRSPNSPLG